MGKRKITIKNSVAIGIAEVAWFIESKGMQKTAERFSDSVYTFIEGLADTRKSFRVCSDSKRASLGWKCVSYKKYTIAFIETNNEIMVCEFISSKMIWW